MLWSTSLRRLSNANPSHRRSRLKHLALVLAIDAAGHRISIAEASFRVTRAELGDVLVRPFLALGLLGKLLDHVAARRYGWIFNRGSRSVACRQALDRGIMVGLDEIAQRYAATANRMVSRRIDDAMTCRFPTVIGPAHHQIPDIDHERPFDNRHVKPFAV